MLGRWSYARCERCPLSWDRSRPTGVDTSSRRFVVGGAQQLWYIAAPVLLGNFAPKIHHLHWLIHNHYAIRIEVPPGGSRRSCRVPLGLVLAPVVKNCSGRGSGSTPFRYSRLSGTDDSDCAEWTRRIARLSL
ncbi:hypothetical protein BD310DRAFT_914307 [Dichomitus squalens]|uniref:Uncharacterized protein n=1 Tax=Dichomitus squalens TaxID=114155 RepID=A0A4Q9Q9P7_9APHY|nr:hypothetical protein BD310DRAFT_914307 [Dichomitus squalens]